MKAGRFAIRLQYSLIGALVVIGSWPLGALAQNGRTQTLTPPHHTPALERKNQAGAFVKLVREATERFQDVSVAEAEGYALTFGCVSGSHEGAMGVHFVNFPMVGDPALDPARPELLVYEPMPNGRLRLVAADYLVIADAWHETNMAPPELMGQLFHLFEYPNRFGLPAFYTLHVWAWEENPQGTFANWNPRVSCNAYNPQIP